MKAAWPVEQDREYARTVARVLAGDLAGRTGKRVRVEESIHHRFEVVIEVPYEPPEARP